MGRGGPTAAAINSSNYQHHYRYPANGAQFDLSLSISSADNQIVPVASPRHAEVCLELENYLQKSPDVSFN